MLSLLRWHVWYGPGFLLTLAWNVQRMLIRFFSVPLLLHTLVSHWHKDAVSYTRPGLSSIALAFAWNMISRVIGFFVRTVTLLTYSVIALIGAVISVLVVTIFFAWPALAIAGIVFSLQALL